MENRDIRCTSLYVRSYFCNRYKLQQIPKCNRKHHFEILFDQCYIFAVLIGILSVICTVSNTRGLQYLSHQFLSPNQIKFDIFVLNKQR